MPMIETYKSQPLPYTPGTTVPIPLNFLDAARNMTSPVIAELRIRILGAWDTGANGGPSRLIPQIFSKVLVQDAAGDRVNVRGSTLRIINQQEYGGGYVDGLNTAANLAAAPVEQYLRIPFYLNKARRMADYGLPLFEFLDGGRIELTGNSATPYPGYVTFLGNNQTTFEIFAKVVEERSREIKSRLCYFDQQIQQTEFNYNVNGRLRYALWYVGETSEPTQTPWPSQNLQSRTLNLQPYPQTYFVDTYESRSLMGTRIGDSTGTTPTEDAVITKQAIPIWSPLSNQKIPQLSDMTTLHIKTDLPAVPTQQNPQVITSVITDRNPAQMVKTLGAPSLGALNSAVKQAGRVKAKNGNTIPVGKMDATVVRHMPLKLGARPANR